MRRKILAALAICGLLGVSSAYASTVDLTSGGTGAINGAIFEWTPSQPTGTGVIEPFVRIQANRFEEGFNTSATPTPLDAKSGLWTHDLLLSDVPVVNVGGTDYLKFLLDINQVNSGDNNLLTMLAFQIYLGAAGGATTMSEVQLGTLIYDMDGIENSQVELNYDLNPGSGAGDMFAYVPTSLITGSNTYLYLYSAFGHPGYASNDGFEEWAIMGAPTPPVPEPGTMILLGAGLLSLAIYGKRRRNDA